MFLPILENVDESRPDFARGAQRPGVITICPHGASPRQDAIDPACEANLEGRNSAGKAIRVVGFDDDVDMIILN
jgi:hypothetical protein